MAFIGGMRCRRLEIPARPFPTSATQAGHYSTKHPFSLSPFWHKCLTQSERTKCPKHTLCTSCSLLKNLSQWLGQAGIRRSSHKILYYVMSPLLYQSYLVMVIWPCPSETQLIDHYWPRSPHPPQFCGGGVHLLTEMSHDRIVGFLQMEVMLFVFIAAVNLISNGKGTWYSYLKYSISHCCLKLKCAKHCILDHAKTIYAAVVTVVDYVSRLSWVNRQNNTRYIFLAIQR